MEDNPLVWMAEVNGLPVDLCHAPHVWQEKAFRQGMIPYHPRRPSETGKEVIFKRIMAVLKPG